MSEVTEQSKRIDILNKNIDKLESTNVDYCSITIDVNTKYLQRILLEGLKQTRQEESQVLKDLVDNLVKV